MMQLAKVTQNNNLIQRHTMHQKTKGISKKERTNILGMCGEAIWEAR